MFTSNNIQGELLTLETNIINIEPKQLILKTRYFISNEKSGIKN